MFAELPPPSPTPMAFRLDYESLSLPTLAGQPNVKVPDPGQRLGMVGLTWTFGGAEGPYAGPALWGAVRGEYGGLIGGGLEGGWRLRLAPGLRAEAGLFAGGSGGGGAPVGSGRMLRGHLGLLADVGSTELGLGVSRTSWPDGSITSSQVAFSVGRRFDMAFAPAGTGEALFSGLDLRDHRFALTFQDWSQPGAFRRPGGELTGGSAGLIGVAWSTLAGPHLFWTVESAAAARGGHSGFMEILGGAGLQTFLDDGRRVGVRGTLLAGPGGGGYVPAGGGLMAKGAVAVFGRFGALEPSLEAGVQRAPGTPFQVFTVTFSTAWVVPVAEPRPGAPVLDLSGLDLRLRTGVVRYSQAQRALSGGQEVPGAPVELVSLGGDLLLGPHSYATGQASFAAQGGAGAYATGEMGLGLQTGLWHGQRLLAEGRLGSGGGAGLATGGGALIQPMAGWMWEAGPAWGLQVLAGRAHSLHGKLDTPVVEAGLVFRTSLLRGR